MHYHSPRQAAKSFGHHWSTPTYSEHFMATPHKRSALTLLAASLAAVSALLSPGAQAEGKISIAQQFGIGYLILDVVRDQQLIEKHGKAQGLDIKVDWNSISGATAMRSLLEKSLSVFTFGLLVSR